MSAPGSRDALLKLALPGLVIAVAYILFGAAGPRGEVQELERKLAKLKAQAPPGNPLSLRKRKLHLESELKGLKTREAQLRHELCDLPGLGDSATRLEGRRRVEDVLTRRGLVLLGSAAPSQRFAPPRSLEEPRARWEARAGREQEHSHPGQGAPLTAKQLRRRNTAKGRARANRIGAQRRREQAPAGSRQGATGLMSLRVRGSYLDMVHALNELSTHELSVIPVGLSLEGPAQGEGLLWTLVVWG